MICEPAPPEVQHVWVRGAGGIGPPDPGVVVDWQRAPVHNANTSDWIALVACCPFEAALIVHWVGAERLIPVRDPRPADAGPLDAG